MEPVERKPEAAGGHVDTTHGEPVRREDTQSWGRGKDSSESVL